MQIHIKNGRVVDPGKGSDTVSDLFVSERLIAGMGAAPSRFRADRVIDATGLVICPGLVDLSARLREPGFEYKATLESEMQAAVAGGIASLVCPPDTDPPLDEPGLVEMLKFRARSLNQARVFPLGALTQGLKGERLTEMAVLRDAGCVAFSQADAAISDKQVLMRALEYATTFGFSVWLRPEDATLARGGVAHDGEVATRLGLNGIPACAETVALSAILILARETGARVGILREERRHQDVALVLHEARIDGRLIELIRHAVVEPVLDERREVEVLLARVADVALIAHLHAVRPGDIGGRRPHLRDRADLMVLEPLL